MDIPNATETDCIGNSHEIRLREHEEQFLKEMLQLKRIQAAEHTNHEDQFRLEQQHLFEDHENQIQDCIRRYFIEQERLLSGSHLPETRHGGPGTPQNSLINKGEKISTSSDLVKQKLLEHVMHRQQRERESLGSMSSPGGVPKSTRKSSTPMNHHIHPPTIVNSPEDNSPLDYTSTSQFLLPGIETNRGLRPVGRTQSAPLPLDHPTLIRSQSAKDQARLPTDGRHHEPAEAMAALAMMPKPNDSEASK